MPHNKIFDGPYDDSSFKHSSQKPGYKINPASVFEHDPAELGVESLSLHESTKRNSKGNPVVVEGYGKINYKEMKAKPEGNQVEDSNRIVPGHPGLIKSTGTEVRNSVMDVDDIQYNKPSVADSQHSSAEEILRRGQPMVFTSSRGRSSAASTSAVDKLMKGVKQSCDNVRAPQDWKSFQRSNEEYKAIATSAIPFEAWHAKPNEEKFDPAKPYRPKQMDFSQPDPMLPVPKAHFRDFNRSAKCFGEKI